MYENGDVNGRETETSFLVAVFCLSGGIRVRIPQELDVVAFWPWNLDVVVF